MYEILTEKSYLSTDYCPSRDYAVVELQDGNGRQWYQLAYRGWLGLRWLNSIRHTDYGDSKSPLKFASEDAAREHIARECDWQDRQNRAKRVTARVIVRLASAVLLLMPVQVRANADNAQTHWPTAWVNVNGVTQVEFYVPPRGMPIVRLNWMM